VVVTRRRATHGMPATHARTPSKRHGHHRENEFYKAVRPRCRGHSVCSVPPNSQPNPARPSAARVDAPHRNNARPPAQTRSSASNEVVEMPQTPKRNREMSASEERPPSFPQPSRSLPAMPGTPGVGGNGAQQRHAAFVLQAVGECGLPGKWARQGPCQLPVVVCAGRRAMPVARRHELSSATECHGE